jgi:hypothetical protein
VFHSLLNFLPNPASTAPHPASSDLRILTIDSPKSGDVRWSVRHTDNP